MGVMKIVLWVVGVLQVVRPVFSQAYREDGLCGSENLAPSGGAAACQHIPPFPTCCQKNGTVAGTVMMLHLRLQLDRLFQELQLPHLQHLNLLLYNHSPVMESTDQMVNVV